MTCPAEKPYRGHLFVCEFPAGHQGVHSCRGLLWGGLKAHISAAADLTLPVAGGLAAILHALLNDDRLARWLRTNPEHEPEAIA